MKTAQFTKPLTIALHPEVYEQIRHLTDEKRISMAKLVRDAIDAALDNFQREGRPDE